MKLLHTADWHLGYRQYGMTVRENDFIAPLKEIAETAIKEQVDAVLITGDIFDSFRPPASAVKTALEFSKTMADAKIPVLSIDGNHDYTDGKWATVCGFTGLGQYNDPNSPYVQLRDIRIAGIDFCHAQKLTAALQEWVDNHVDLDGGVLCLHAEIAELAAYSTALSLQEIEPYLDKLNVGYVALGHIHNKVYTTTETGRIYRYSGSTEMNDISELGLKSIDIISHTNKAYAVESLNLKTRKFEVVDIDSADTVETKLANILTDTDTFWLVKVNLSSPGNLIARVEELLKDKLYRILPYGNKTIEAATTKDSLVVGLKDAIIKFFEPTSDEASLISRLIDTPLQTKEIVSEYVSTRTNSPNK